MDQPQRAWTEPRVANRLQIARMSRLTELTNVLIAECLSFLCPATNALITSCVCKRFDELVRSPEYRLFRSLRLGELSRRLPDEHAWSTLACIERLDLEECSCDTDELERALSVWTSLQYISLFNVQLNSTELPDDDHADTRWLEPVFARMSQIKLNCLKLTDSDVDYRLVTALTGSRASQSIRCLSFAYCENFGDAALSVILNSVPNLERLDLTQCQLLTADSASLFQLECAPILKVLNLAELEIIDSAWLLTAFSRYARGIAPIQLCLETCRNITDDDVLLLGRTFADRLLELDISDNQRLSNAAISHISQYCNKIKWLNLSGCDAFSDEPLRNLLVCCRELEELVVENCANISFEFDETTSSQDFASPMALNNLESLDIDDASVAVMVDSVALSTSLTSLKSKQSGLSVVAMLSLARFCPNLSKIDMCECRRASMSSRSTLPKIAFWKFFVHPQLSIRTLTELHLSHAASLDDTFLSSIFRQHSKTLRVLSLSQFPDFSVNDHVISEIAHTCIQLSRLTLNNCSGVTDVGISYFTDSTAAISLSYFNLSGCEQVTALSALKLVIAAGRSSRALQSLLQDDDDYVEYDDEIQQTVTREDALCQLEVQANNEQYSPSLPYLSVVQVKFSGVGEFGTNLLKHARLLQEFDTVNYHWAEKFF